MYKKKKERLYITEMIEDPPISYPMYYTVSASMKENEMLLEALRAVHLSDFDNHQEPLNAAAIFETLGMGTFPIYKEQYVVGNFGGKLMFLDSAGWKSLTVTQDIFDLNQWLI